MFQPAGYLDNVLIAVTVTVKLIDVSGVTSAWMAYISRAHEFVQWQLVFDNSTNRMALYHLSAVGCE